VSDVPSTLPRPIKTTVRRSPHGTAYVVLALREDDYCDFKESDRARETMSTLEFKSGLVLSGHAMPANEVNGFLFGSPPADSPAGVPKTHHRLSRFLS
jgi:hypothetical protein